ncbi:hypothetical protein PG993_013207 [Apiospora rasikravindrae]|uniref:Uncharacterized protein n=1 Tax=Apiospora rasikravindrae TaxID=990691 RepID=A0ABR1RX03_9PEZI
MPKLSKTNAKALQYDWDLAPAEPVSEGDAGSVGRLEATAGDALGDALALDGVAVADVVANADTVLDKTTGRFRQY